MIDGKFLSAVHRHAAGNPANWVDMLEVGNEVGLASAEIKRVVQRLMAEGLVGHELHKGCITLTAAGCRRAEEGLQLQMLPSKDQDGTLWRRRIFISYSRRDAKWLARLKVHLQPLAREGLLEIWDDHQIEAGSDWENEILLAITTAAVAVLLVSADFLASEFINRRELPALLAAAEERGLRIIPLIVSPSIFELEPLGRFKAFNPPASPLRGMAPEEQEKVLANLAATLKNWVRR